MTSSRDDKMAAYQHPVTDGTRFKSEMFVPIRKDSQNFEERQRSIWDDMHERMERRRHEWDQEVSRMRKDFFRLRPDDVSAGRRSSDAVEAGNMYCDGPDGNKLFRVSFDVSQFEPSEVSVKTQEQRLVVHAKHEEKGSDKTVSREFSRQVDIPHNVDPQTLHSTLSNDGILQIEAAVIQSPPSYRGLSPPGASTSSLPYRLYTPTPTPNIPSPSMSPGPSSVNVGPSVTERDGSQVFRIIVDIGAEFEPGDLHVKTVDKKLVVQARHEEKAPGRTSCREFNREFDLPDAVDPMSVTAGMSSEGKLVIEAPISSYSQGSYSGRPGSVKQPSFQVSFAPSSSTNH